MATMNPFDLLGDDDAEDPSQLVAAHQPKPAASAAAAAVGSQSKKPSPAQSKPAAVAAQPAAKLPSKPLPPAQAGLSFSIRRRFDCFFTLFYVDWFCLVYSISICIRIRTISVMGF